MANLTYEERRDNLAVNSSILIQVMMGAARGDVEFSLVHPRPANGDVMEAELKARWPGRGLRAVGFVGLVDGAPQLVSKELLDSIQIEALAVAAGIYFATLVKSACSADSFAAEMERAELSELDRLYSVPDTRYLN